MSGERPWTEVVLKALESLGADRRAVPVAELYEAVRRIAPSRCDDSYLYEVEVRGKRYSEPRWRRNVRDALVKLERRGIVVRERKGLWRLTPPQT
jgi:hypothetical protein